MGINGPKYDSSSRRQIHLKVFRGLGLNKFKIGIYKFDHPGAVASHVVTFKIKRSAFLTHPLVQQCRTEAEAVAPWYLCRRETADAVTTLRLSLSHSARMGYVLETENDFS